MKTVTLNCLPHCFPCVWESNFIPGWEWQAPSVTIKSELLKINTMSDYCSNMQNVMSKREFVLNVIMDLKFNTIVYCHL